MSERARVAVHFLPSTLAADLSDTAAIVIDVLRATTTIVAALEAGCRGVVPIVSLEDTLAAAASGRYAPSLTAGERGGAPIPGLDHGNSPLEFSRARCEGRTLLLTTTNGSGALRAAADRGAASVRAGCLWNATAAADAAIASGSAAIAVVCAGTRAEFALEDAVTAGEIVAALGRRSNGRAIDLADSARAALAIRERVGDGIERAFRESLGGRSLLALEGGERDLVACTAIDRSRSVPLLLPSGMLVLANASAR